MMYMYVFIHSIKLPFEELTLEKDSKYIANLSMVQIDDLIQFTFSLSFGEFLRIISDHSEQWKTRVQHHLQLQQQHYEINPQLSYLQPFHNFPSFEAALLIVYIKVTFHEFSTHRATL